MADDLKRVGLIFKADGTVDFKKSLQEVNSSISENVSAFKLAQSQWNKNTTSVEKLGDRQKYLSQMTKDYSDKVKMLQGELEELENREKNNTEKIKVKREQLEAAKNTSETYKKKCADLRSELEKIESEENANEEAIKKKRAQLEKAEKGFSDYSSRVEKITSELEKLNKKEANNETAINKKKTQLNQAKTSLNNYKKALNDVSKEVDNFKNQYTKAMEDIDKNMEKAGEGIQKGATVAATAIAATATALVALGASTEEYRTNQAKLNAAFETAGTSASVAKDTYNDLYRVLGDGGQATEAANHLAKLTTGEKELAEWTDICKGIYATFGDSLPIEGLTEAANETVRTGQVTGNLADALNWSKLEGETFGVTLKENTKANEEWNKAVQEATTAEDYFNLALQQCGTEAEREKLVRETLNGIYDEAADKYEETAGDVLAQNEAQAKLQETTAKLGEAVTPVITAFTNFANEALAVITPYIQELSEKYMPTLKDILEKVAEAIGIALGALVENWGVLLAVGGVITGIATAIALYNTVAAIKTAMDAAQTATLGGLIKAQLASAAANLVAIAPYLLIVAAIAAVIAIIVVCVKHWDEIKEKVKEVWKKIKEATSEAVEKVKQKFQEMKQAISDKVKAVKESVVNKFNEIKTGITEKIDGARESVRSAIEKIKSFFNFEWKLPKIKLPHFKISGDFSLIPPKIPKFSVSWYAKGGILNSPTIFGMNGNSLLGGGEAGAEAVLPIELLKKYIREENSANNSILAEMIKAAIAELNIVAENNIYIGDKKLVSVLTDMVIKKLSQNARDMELAKGTV